MEIKTRRCTGDYIDVAVIEGVTRIEMGLLNESGREELAKTLINAAWELGPRWTDDCVQWMASMIAKCGIKLPPSNASGQGAAKPYPAPACSPGGQP